MQDPLMDTGTDQEAVYCDSCRKTTGTGRSGSHWICEDCRIESGDEAQEPWES